MQLVDTHCHIQEVLPEGESGQVSVMWQKAGVTIETILRDAQEAGVSRMICVGNTLEDSKLAVGFVQEHENLWASIGIHPHEAKDYVRDPKKLDELAALADRPKVVAVGETGLDYHYLHSSKEEQQALLRFHLEVARKYDLPLIFHVREAFDDFWPILDAVGPIKGVVHSFSTNKDVLQEVLSHGLYVGLNGIMTFTKDEEQLVAAKTVPLEKLLLETDAPFLTPKPYRGTICEPKHVFVTAKFLAELRGEELNTLAAATTHNAQTLFGL